MATCSVKGCKKKPFQDGLCTDHMPKAKKADGPVYTWQAGLVNGALKPDDSFFVLCESSSASEPYKQRIEHLRQAGPQRGGGVRARAIP